jgi:NitT/TauT family transport system ATP-binding protein
MSSEGGADTLSGESRAGAPIAVVRVSHDYESDGNRLKALMDIDLRVEAGEFVVLLGPSGCGKSTLLLIVAGLLAPSLGRITIGERIVTEPYTDLGIVFQDATLLEWRTALRNILLQAEARHMDKATARERALKLMESTKLRGFEGAYPAELSGGMKQRVAICRALLHDPPLLLMDEPFAALDALTREQMAIDLQALWLKDRKTVLFVTHSIPEAVFLADRIVVFSSRPGKILETITVAVPRPRTLDDQKNPAFIALVARITSLLREQGVLDN